MQTDAPLAAMPRRAAAWLIDAYFGLVLSVLFVMAAGGRGDVDALVNLLLFKSVTGKAGHELSSALNPASADVAALAPLFRLLAILSVIAFAGVAYRVVTTARWGAGIGKAMLGLRVVVEGAAAPGAPGWRRAWKRWAVPQLPGLIPLPATGLLAYATALRDPRRRGLHDRAAGTVVVDVRRTGR